MFLCLGLSENQAWADGCEEAKPGDDPRLFVLTMPPGSEVWQSFGHVALWFSPGFKQPEPVFNWGAFDTNIPNPLMAFLEGRIEYELMVEPRKRTLSRYRPQNRTMVAQRLDLPPSVVTKIAKKLKVAAKPENRPYNYHWLFRNCATRIRDLLDETMGGTLQSQHLNVTPHTSRSEVLRHFGPVWPIWFGWHFMASGYADQPLVRWDTMFLPDRLMEALDESTVRWPDGTTRPLVAERCEVMTGTLPWADPTPPNRAPVLWSVGLAWGASVFALARRDWRWPAGLSVMFFGLVTGFFGTVTVFFWSASSLEGFGQNENWFQASPLSWMWIWIGWRIARGTLTPRVVQIARLLASIGCLGVLVSLLPVTPQMNGGIIGLFLPVMLATVWVVDFAQRVNSKV